MKDVLRNYQKKLSNWFFENRDGLFEFCLNNSYNPLQASLKRLSELLIKSIVTFRFGVYSQRSREPRYESLEEFLKRELLANDKGLKEIIEKEGISSLLEFHDKFYGGEPPEELNERKVKAFVVGLQKLHLQLLKEDLLEESVGAEHLVQRGDFEMEQGEDGEMVENNVEEVAGREGEELQSEDRESANVDEPATVESEDEDVSLGSECRASVNEVLPLNSKYLENDGTTRLRDPPRTNHTPLMQQMIALTDMMDILYGVDKLSEKEQHACFAIE